MKKSYKCFLDYYDYDKFFNVIIDNKIVTDEEILNLNLVFIHYMYGLNTIDEIGLIINSNQALIIENVKPRLGEKPLLVRPWVDELHHHNLGCCEVRTATYEELKFFGKAWHRYIKAYTESKSTAPFIPSLMIPEKELGGFTTYWRVNL